MVIDEAHRLRNVYKPSNVIANTLKLALAGKDKLLLDRDAASELVARTLRPGQLHRRARLWRPEELSRTVCQRRPGPGVPGAQGATEALCHRTLRRQVSAYIPYTRRLPIVQPFTPEENEDRLYHLVSDYLRRDNLQALPASQRSLMTLVLRKLLASSTFAIAGALTSISNRLKARLARTSRRNPSKTRWPRTTRPLTRRRRNGTRRSQSSHSPPPIGRPPARDSDLDGFATLATSIEHNAKGRALLRRSEPSPKLRLGAAQKAIIFTESRRTQSYLLRVLVDSPFAKASSCSMGRTPTRPSRSTPSGSSATRGPIASQAPSSADIRSALVDYFREQGRIMIATEAGAEGIISSSALWS